MECKFWIDIDNFEITTALEYNLTPQSKREIKKIIYEHFDYIVSELNKYFKRKMMEKAYNITDISFENDFIIVKVDNLVIKLELADISDKLAKVTDKQRLDFKISPSGYGIHWIQLDEDLSINGLLEVDKSKHAIKHRT